VRPGSTLIPRGKKRKRGQEKQNLTTTKYRRQEMKQQHPLPNLRAKGSMTVTGSLHGVNEILQNN
jgi:hypothetical protein